MTGAAIRLPDRSLLASWDTFRQRNTIRRTLGGTKNRDALNLHADALSTCTGPSEPSAEPTKQPEIRENR
jgi:hypothetical protein